MREPRTGRVLASVFSRGPVPGPARAAAAVAAGVLAGVVTETAAAGVPRGYWQPPAVIEKGFRGLIHPANGYHFDAVFARCEGVGPSYRSSALHALVFDRFSCHYVISYVEDRPDDDCTASVVLFAAGGVLRDKLVGHPFCR